MTKFAKVDFDTIAPLMPFDKTAAQVAAGGENFEWQPPPYVRHLETPIITRRATPREKMSPGFVDLTGARCGRLNVLGISEDSPQDKRRWVVRCQCGDYEVRRAKTIKAWLRGENVGLAMCYECAYTQKLIQGRHSVKKAEAAAQAIQEIAKMKGEA